MPVIVENTPFAFVDPSSGKKYAVSGLVWIEIDPEHGYSDLNKYMIRKAKKVVESQQNKSYKIAGSTGKIYSVNLKNNQWSCDCVGFGYHRRCKHVKAAQNGIV